ncbi:MAG: hypothetical protein LBD52_07485 [Prevotellaceae bacterium]|jgi:hypothetical protein|nr:hypothetical protein [Prevotellaceae bacterium]
MSVSISTLKTAIKAAFDAEKDKTDDQFGSIDRISEAIAKAVATQIVQGINTAEVVPVLAAPNGPVSGSITITAAAS